MNENNVTPVESSVCDNCKREPEIIIGLSAAGQPPIQCFYHVLDSESMDPAVLMSNGDLQFCLFPEKTHPVLEEKKFLCCRCFNAMFSEDTSEL